MIDKIVVDDPRDPITQAVDEVMEGECRGESGWRVIDLTFYEGTVCVVFCVSRHEVVAGPMLFPPATTALLIETLQRAESFRALQRHAATSTPQ